MELDGSHKGRTEEADEYDGEVDFGAEFQSQDMNALHYKRWFVYRRKAPEES